MFFIACQFKNFYTGSKNAYLMNEAFSGGIDWKIISRKKIIYTITVSFLQSLRIEFKNVLREKRNRGDSEDKK